jgi:undecaprenyl pyrophosphate synthase
MILQKEKSIKLSDYFKIIKPNYVYIQIIPHKSIRNYNSSNIAKSIAHTYKAINKKVRFEQKKIFFETNFKISYIVDIYKNNANFYFLVPEIFKNILIEKIKEIWTKATISALVGGLMSFTENMEMYQLSYKKEDALSLQVDRKSNEPLNSILNVMDIMKDDDRVTIVYNFLPSTQFGWMDKYNQTMEKIKEMKPVDKNKLTISSIAMNGIYLLLNIIDSVLNVVNDFLGGDELDDKNNLYKEVLGVIKQEGELSTSTKKKKEATILNTQIAILADGADRTRKENNVLSVCQSYRVLDEDNELIYKKVKRKKIFNMNDYDFNIEKNIISTEEASNFIQIPGRTLLNYFNINHIKVEEVRVPEELKKGYIGLGYNKNKGNILEVYLEDHKEIGNLPLMLLGRQGGGKSTYIANYVKFVTTRKESVIHIDFIRNNEVSKDIEKVIPNSIVLDFSTEEGLQALAYNEIKFTDDMTWYDKQQLANKKTQLTIELVNSINENGEPLSPKMERYLCACTDIVYLNEYATFKDVIRCLQDFRYRENIINNIPRELKEELEEEIQTLEELDEWSKPTKDSPSDKIGTRDSKIEGVLDRITLLKRDFYLKKMFNKSPEHNLDFVTAMEEGKVILVRMPQSKFKKYVKNVITTFLVTKCWLACELRGDLSDRSKRSHVIIDEISQTKTAERYMESILTQTRKFGMKFVLTGQYLDQLDKETIYTLKGAGTSFMLLKGAIKEDFEYFKDELDGIYEYEDLKEMEEYSSLNIVQYSKGYSSFITRLPKPI